MTCPCACSTEAAELNGEKVEKGLQDMRFAGDASYKMCGFALPHTRYAVCMGFGIGYLVLRDKRFS